MLAPRFDVVHLEIIRLEIGDRHAQMIQFAARENIAANRGRSRSVTPAAAKTLETFRTQRDRVMKVQAARLEQAINGLEIGRIVRNADLLEHPDGRDLVEASLNLCV